MRRFLFIAVGLALAAPFIGAGTIAATAQSKDVTNRFAPSGIHTLQPPSVAGTRAAIKAIRAPASSSAIVPAINGTSGCRDASAHNVRANQECTNVARLGLAGRGQSQNETSIAVNPTNPKNVLASQNDYRKGDAACGADFSLNGGRNWGSELAPTTFTAPGNAGAARHYWDASGDPSVAFDADGYAYYACLMFDRGATADFGDNASGIFVLRSADGGASWTFPADAVAQTDGTGADGVGLHDKEWLTVDANAGSPWLNRVYVVWVRYNVEFTKAEIVESHSSDHGVTWSAVQVINGSDVDLCPINFSGAPAGECDANQFPYVFTSPNGTVFAVFDNYNNCAGAIGAPCTGDPGDNHNQVLLVESTDGGATWSSPVKVADFYDLPDCFTYTGFDAGRACVPTAPLSGVSIFRAANYPTAAALSDDEIVVDFGSYINPHSNPTLGNCTPTGFSAFFLNTYDGVGDVGGCNNDILRSTSTDGGATFTGTATPPDQLEARSGEGDVPTDQWWQGTAKSPKTGKAPTAFYDRQYGDDQASGFMDLTMRTSKETLLRLTDFSLPPSNEFPASNGFSTFLGDYIQMAVGPDGTGYVAWADTRNPIFVYDPSAADTRVPVFAGFGADIYTRGVPNA